MYSQEVADTIERALNIIGPACLLLLMLYVVSMVPIVILWALNELANWLKRPRKL